MKKLGKVMDKLFPDSPRAHRFWFLFSAMMSVLNLFLGRTGLALFWAVMMTIDFVTILGEGDSDGAE